MGDLKMGKKVVITCHYCGEVGHKVSHCHKMPPEMRTQQGGEQTLTGKTFMPYTQNASHGGREAAQVQDFGRDHLLQVWGEWSLCKQVSEGSSRLPLKPPVEVEVTVLFSPLSDVVPCVRNNYHVNMFFQIYNFVL